MAFTVGNRTVRMVDDNGDGSITLTLARGEDGERRQIRLPEPNALDYAHIREMLETVDDGLRSKFPEPTPPTIPDDMDAAEAGLLAAEWQQTAARYNRDVNRFVRNPDDPPYAQALIDIIDRLTKQRLTLADLPVESFDMVVCAALLRIWEGPSDGPVAPAASPEQPGGSEATPEMVGPAESAVGSVEPEASLLPGTEPAIPSHLPS